MKPLLTRRFFAGLTAALVGAVGLLTLVAWGLDLWQLVAMGTSYIPMAPITALLMVFLAAALAGRLWLAGRRSVTWATRAGMGCALAVAPQEWLQPSPGLRLTRRQARRLTPAALADPAWPEEP